MIFDGLRVGYSPYSPTLTRPGDRRRFCFYARHRGVEFEIAHPDRTYDVVVLSARADITTWRQYRVGEAKIVYDLIDSYLALPRLDAKSLLRGTAKFVARETRDLAFVYRKAIEQMCRRADAVICSTEEQRAEILRMCPNVHVILDSHSTLLRARKSDYAIGEVVNLVWEGLPHTLDDFASIVPVLREIAAEHPLALHLVTDLHSYRYMGRFGRRDTATLARKILPDTYLYQWNEIMVSSVVTSCDVAVIPLDLGDPFAAGKPENKLLIFWRLGLPAVTAATPAYSRAMAEAGTPMLTCATKGQWAEALRRTIADEDLRRRSAAAGRTYAETVHGDDRLLEQWDRLFESVLT